MIAVTIVVYLPLLVYPEFKEITDLKNVRGIEVVVSAKSWTFRFETIIECKHLSVAECQILALFLQLDVKR